MVPAIFRGRRADGASVKSTCCEFGCRSQTEDHSEACIVSSSRAIHVTTLAHSPLSRRNCCDPFLLPPTPLDITIVPFTHQFNRTPQPVTLPLAPRTLGDSIVSAPATLDSLLFARCASRASVVCKARSDGQRQHPLTPRSSQPSSWPNI